MISDVKPGGEVFGDTVLDRDVKVAEVSQEVVHTTGRHVDKGRHSRPLQQLPVGRVVGVTQEEVRQDFNRPIL